MTEVDKGTIIWLDFGPGQGHEQQERRPALVVSERDFNSASGFVWALPITGQVKGRPDEIRLPKGLKTHGVVLFSQIKTLDLKARDWEFAEAVPDEFMDEQITGRLAAILGI